ncbi:polysaccharide deacetylase family protein [Metallumcola ferriviriculae]|uniref:Polysaccharide deacetylase family protein n=1 Tax=Metallumcola ferriviriculae TaxID=3039180 RepID=A0AAU0UNL3_9FIRM|nr:polysaccharide deacetylase family protein [Desulfitibacteraceae bacterium MK1]
MRYWLTLLITSTVIFALTFLLGLSIIGVDIFGPEETGHGHEQTIDVTTHADDDNTDSQHKDNVEVPANEAEATEQPVQAETAVEPDAPDKPEIDEEKHETSSNDEITAKDDGTENTSSKSEEEKEVTSQEVSFDFNMDTSAFITIKVLDAGGKTVAVPFENYPVSKGSQQITWQAKVDSKPLAPARYHYVVEQHNRGVPVLLYHEISASKEVNLYTESLADFRKQMQYLSSNGYQAIRLEQLTNYMSTGQKLPEKSVLITFGDGYKSTYTRALPILKELNFKAALFTLGNFLDNSTGPSALAMNWQELEKLADSGLFTIASHSYNLHSKELLYQNSQESDTAYRERLKQDFVKLNAKIKEITGAKPTALSWPAPQTPTAFIAAKESGYRYFFRINSSSEENFYGSPLTDIKWSLVPSNATMDNFKKMVEIETTAKKVAEHYFTIQ